MMSKFVSAHISKVFTVYNGCWWCMWRDGLSERHWTLGVRQSASSDRAAEMECKPPGIENLMKLDGYLQQYEGEITRRYSFIQFCSWNLVLLLLLLL